MNVALANSCRVLIYGSDETLLQTRQEVLKFAGFPSDITSDGQNFLRHMKETARVFDLFIVCHSVPVNEQLSLALAAKRAQVELVVLEGLVLPEEFISCVRRLAATC
jgi:DNA-binding response OmpR family regulator